MADWLTGDVDWDTIETIDTDSPPFKIEEMCNKIADMLMAKNKAYGNSALEPVCYLSNANALERLAVRIDDKINRMAQGEEYPGDDTILDLAGYLVLYLIAREDQT